MKLPNQTASVERKANSKYTRAAGQVNPSFGWGALLDIGKKALGGALQGAMS